MKAVKFIYGTVFTLIVSSVVFGQTEIATTRERVSMNNSQAVKPIPQPKETPVTEEVKTETKTSPDDKAAETSKTENSSETSSDEEAVVSYYNNYLKEYRLGPNDVITVEVFGQCPDYCKPSITVPPTARISYPLIREGILVAGKTVREVEDEIAKKLDEYIIDPKVTVTLDKAMSVRYSVMGNVAAPGMRIMGRKVSLYEAVIEAGGITKNADKKKVSLIRYDAKGGLTRQEVNLIDIENGKVPMIYLNAGDQVFVPKKGFSLNWETFSKVLAQASAVRFLFGSPF